MSDYKRLTEKCEVGIGLTETSGNIVNNYQKVVNRLGELEDKIENGMLIELPCKVGDTVYFINDYGMGHYKIIPFNVRGFKIEINNRLYVLFDFDAFAFAEDIFTTKESAEAKIKELQEKE